MTYSIIARDPGTGEMGVAAQSQAFAIGSSVTWALPGYGVIATQSMGEPMYGELGLDVLRSGLTAPEALAALRSVDPHPDRRQVAMLDGRGGIDVYTGEACVESAGHIQRDGCVALANMVAGPEVWEAMVNSYVQTAGPMAERLVAALRAAEEAGGDFRGSRSASLMVVRAERTGRPWQDSLVDLRIDDHTDPVGELERMTAYTRRYHLMVEAFEAALDGDVARGRELADEVSPDPEVEPELAMWHAVVAGLDGDRDTARDLLGGLERSAPQFVVAIERFEVMGLCGEGSPLAGLLGDTTRDG